MAQTPKTFGQYALTRSLATTYTAPNGITADLITDIQISNNTRLDTPQAPTITNVGTTGTTTYNYYVVAVDAWGGKTLVGPVGSTTTGNATLSASNYNIITWAPVQGAVTYDILKGNMTTSLATNITGTVNGTNLTYNDTGQGTAAYTTPTSNSSGKIAYVTLHHVPSGGTASLTNRFAASVEVDPGTQTSIKVNRVLAPGDFIQTKTYANVNADTNIDSNVSMTLSGVEFN